MDFVKKATVACNGINIVLQVKNIICADSIGEVVVSMFASGIGIGNDIRRIVSAVIHRNWSNVVYNLVFYVEIYKEGVYGDANRFRYGKYDNRIVNFVVFNSVMSSGGDF